MTPSLEARKTRAQIFRESVKLRLAEDAQGLLIAEILKENGIELPASTWEKVHPYWILAMFENEVIGCCQILVAKPVGYIEFLAVKKTAPFKLRVIAVRKLIEQGITTLRLSGADYACGAIATANEQIINAAKNLGLGYAGTVQVLCKPLKTH